MSVFNQIKSYGVILFTIVKGENGERKPLYLLYQRRDTFGYMDFMRGAWSLEGNLRSLLITMTPQELLRLKTFTFDELWNDLWTTPNCRIFRDGYSRARRKFDSVQEILPGIIDTINTPIKSTSWGFPKGKKNFEDESDIAAAIREFREETRFTNERIDIIPDVWFSESFQGTNNKFYATKYFVAKSDKPYKVKYMELVHSRIRKFAVSEEAEHVNWFTLEKALDHLSDSPQRCSILMEIHRRVMIEEFAK